MRRYGVYLVGWIAGAAVFLGMDAAWLTLASDRLYRPELGALLAPQPRMAPAVLFYVIYLAGMFGFCAVPGSRKAGAVSAGWRGAAFGLVAYATYDLTNQATLADWSTRVTLFDLGWGALVTGVSAAVAAAVLRAVQQGGGRR